MKYAVQAIALSAILSTVASYTWPSAKIDYLEDVMYVQSGYRRSAFLDAVNPCSFSFHQEGRMTAAEWVRSRMFKFISCLGTDSGTIL